MEVIEVAGKLLGLAVADLGTESASEDEDTCWTRNGSGASYEGGGSEDEDGVSGKRKRMSADDRKARNRERNRLHARKTRQRKKQHVQELQLKIWGLRRERQRLLQLSKEHHTAGVLLALSCSPKQCVQRSSSHLSTTSAVAAQRTSMANKPSAAAGRDWSRELAAHEEALRKITREFESMDGSQHVGDDEDGAAAAACDDSVGRSGGSGKGSRAGKGTLADRMALRRERNRMHAKRTRNRKKLFVEACSVMIDKMKVENAQLEHEIRASGVRLPSDVWAEDGLETVPEEPLPEYLAALWDFAEGKTHTIKPQQQQSPAPSTPAHMASTAARASRKVSSPASKSISTRSATPMTRQSRQAFSSSPSSSVFSGCTDKGSRSSISSVTSNCSSSSGFSESNSNASITSSSVVSASAKRSPRSLPTAGQALEDASTLCAFMEAAQTRAAKRPRGSRSTHHQQQNQPPPPQQSRPRLWSDHGSTTSESRGSLESDEEIALGRNLEADGKKAISDESKSNGEVLLSPAFWTSRQVLERYVLPRQVC